MTVQSTYSSQSPLTSETTDLEKVSFNTQTQNSQDNQLTESEKQWYENWLIREDLRHLQYNDY